MRFTLLNDNLEKVLVLWIDLDAAAKFRRAEISKLVVRFKDERINNLRNLPCKNQRPCTVCLEAV